MKYFIGSILYFCSLFWFVVFAVVYLLTDDIHVIVWSWAGWYICFWVTLLISVNVFVYGKEQK
jgi:hypothetical protein